MPLERRPIFNGAEYNNPGIHLVRLAMTEKNDLNAVRSFEYSRQGTS